MEDSIFTKIINGSIPSHKIYEDESTYAFLDINPVNEGHVLVVPKRQVEFVWDLNEEDYNRLVITVKHIALKLRRAYPGSYVSQMVVGVDVPHAHVHLIPFTDSNQLSDAFNRIEHAPDHESLHAVADRITHA